MSIRRAARKQSNFTIIDNVVFSSDLSFRAMGILSYLLSKPDHWEVSVAQLSNYARGTAKADGRDAIYSMLSELIDKGFVERVQVRNEQGRMVGTDYVVYDTPRQPEPLTDKPYTDKPLTAEPTQVSTEVKVNTETSVSTDKNPTLSEQVEKVFDAWKVSMGKSNRTVLDNKRKTRIEWALKNYGLEDCLKAIRGCSKSSFHMGSNDKGTPYNGLDLIFRNAEKTEQFIGWDDNPPIQANDGRRKVQLNNLPTEHNTGLNESEGRRTL